MKVIVFVLKSITLNIHTDKIALTSLTKVYPKGRHEINLYKRAYL